MKDNQEFKFKVDRRSFLSRTTCASLGLGSMVNTLAHLSLIDRAAANAINIGNDYKALICIFLRGGCDKYFWLVPRLNHPQSGQYTSSRGVAGIFNGVVEPTFNPTGIDNTLPITPGNAANDHFGLNPSCPNMAGMFNAGEMAIMQNIGTLAEPTTKTQYQNGTVLLPTQLFSHSNQVQEWMATAAEKPFTSGWAGSVSNLVNDTYNKNVNMTGQDGLASMLITAAGNNNWLVAPPGGVPQYSVTSSGSLSLVGYNSGNVNAGGAPYGNAIDVNTGVYKNTLQGRRLRAFERVMNYTHDHILSEGYNEVVRRARANEGVVGDALLEAAALQGTGGGQVDFDGNFPNSNVANELKLIAQLIAGRRCIGNARQIFFCDLGGFDNHASINGNLPGLLAQVDAAVGGFNTTMKELADADAEFDYNDFTCFEMSDFARTFTPNGTSVANNGTDHAWGTYSWCFGGAVAENHNPGTGLTGDPGPNSSNLYGTYPTLDPNGVDSVSGRGRYIPTTSVDQYGSILAEWFGVANGDLSQIFPNLPRFDAPAAANMEFIDLIL